MRVFSQGRLAHGLARALRAAFLWSALFSGLAVLPAGAQVVTRSATSQSVAVIPFQNLTNYCPDTYGSTAADAVAVDLRDRLSLDVLPNTEVALQMKNLGMSVPLPPQELVRLASELEVSMIVTGDVREADVVVDRGNRYARVTLGVLLFDRPTEGFVNGALVTAVSPSSLEASGDDLIAKALKQASFQAAQEMKTRPTITAMVLWSKGGRIFTNTGTRGGVMFGMKMAAIRGGQRIAEVRVTSTEPTGSYATVVAGTDLRTGDHLRALYEIRGTTRPDLKTRIKRQAPDWQQPLLTAALLLGVSNFATASRTIGEGNVAAPSFAASNLSNQLALSDVSSAPLMLGVGYVTWTKFSNTQKNRIAAYELYRGGNWFWINFPSAPDEPFEFDMNWGPSVLVTTLDLDPLSGNLFLTRSIDTWDGITPKTFGEFVDQFPIGITGGEEDTSITYGLVLSTPTPGIRYNYRVKPLIIANHQLPDSPFSNWVFVRSAAEYSSSQNFATIVAPPATDQALVIGSVATFIFYQPVGADEMTLQVQRDQGAGRGVDFAPAYTLQRVIGGLDLLPPGFFGFAVQSIQVNLSDLQALPGTSGRFYWRVGARNRGDVTQPRPWPLDLTNEYGWVWSFPINNLELTGAARAALTREQQDRLNLLRTNRTLRVRTRTDDRPMRVPR